MAKKKKNLGHIIPWGITKKPVKKSAEQELVEALEKIMSYTKLGIGSIARIRGIAGKALKVYKGKI
jgi:hypothetical protein